MNKVAISGLTAAGKTTHAQILAKDLGCESIHVTDLLLRRLNVRDSSRSVWFNRLHEIESMRDGGTVDDEVDAHLLHLCKGERTQVFDAWALPWYGPQDMVKIWIGSDRLSRSWKCSVSSELELDTERSAKLIDTKDALTRERFASRYGFDIYQDRSVFDFVLDNTHLISRPHTESTEAGIRIFKDVVRICARAGLGGDCRELADFLSKGDRNSRACIVEIGPRILEKWGRYIEPLISPSISASRRI